MKKFLSLALSVILMVGMSIPASAAEFNNRKPDSSKIYEEKGQIVFDKVNLIQTNGQVKIAAASNQEQAANLASKLKDSKIQEVLSEYMAQGKTPVAIGWTTVRLKEDSTGGGVVPMTVEDMNQIQTRGSNTGHPTTKGNLSLYTMVGFDNYNPKALFANSVAKWSGGTYGSSGPASDNDDFITMTWPNGHVLLSSTVYGSCSGSYKKDEAYSSVVWGFREKSGTIQLATNGKKDSSGGTRKWVSKYVHTWGDTIPSFTFSLTDVGITLTNSRASWQIASSVIF